MLKPVAKLIKSDGWVYPCEPKDGKAFTYDELRMAVDGMVHIVRPKSYHGVVMVINEEGKVLGLPPNKLATDIWQDGAEPGSPRMQDAVVGDVIVCHESQLGIL